MRTVALVLWLTLVTALGLVGAQPAPPTPGPTTPLLETLVSNSLRVADEDDPLQRARSCIEVADRLNQLVAAATTRKDHTQATRLAGYIDQILQEGVDENVARLEQGELDKRHTEVESLRQRTFRISSDLDDLLKTFPDSVRVPLPPGLKGPKGFDKQGKSKSKG